MDDHNAAWHFVGSCIRLARRAHNLTLADLANQVGLETSHLSRAETGERRLSPEHMRRLSEVLRLDELTARAHVAKVQAVGTCQHCGADMPTARATRKFCGSTCRQRAHRNSRPGRTPVVYFLRRGDHVKIGTTSNLSQRVSAFQQTMADVMGTVPGGDGVERQWHRRFAHLHDADTYGGKEWFRAAPDLLDAIEAETLRLTV